jgi:eukaryotic-like serine/threonine-protein kinase
MVLPSRIGKYELTEFLGGGMSHVYRAKDTVMGRAVAIKVLTEAACQDASAKARFLLEARMAGNIAHENVVSIFDYGEDDQGRPYMVMEFLQGEDLKTAIEKGHTGQLRDKIRIALPIARALQCVHNNKLIHRDVKPDNVHINTQGVVKLIDFGIAKSEAFSITQAGFVLGTPYYMAPEQVRGGEVTSQVDVYAFGILLFELLAGMRPLQGDTLERIFFRILNDPLDLEPLRKMGAPQAMLDLVAKCTAKNPAERPQGFAPVIATLERILTQGDALTEALPTPRIEPAKPAAIAPSRRAWLIPAVALGGLLLVTAIYLAVRPKQVSVAEAPRKSAPAQVITTPTGEMVLVPGGEFLFGEKKERLTLPAFYIDRTEATNAAYADFCRATGHPLPPGFSKNHLDWPVVNVSFADAHDFAAWAGKRLPKPAEWEKAARGTDGRAFPWGDKADPKLANVNTQVLRPAGAFSEGASPYGALQMVGNVWEFVDATAIPTAEALESFPKLKPRPSREEPWYTIRGQSSGERLFPSVIWDSIVVPGRWKDRYLGFRCVKDVSFQ